MIANRVLDMAAVRLRGFEKPELTDGVGQKG